MLCDPVFTIKNVYGEHIKWYHRTLIILLVKFASEEFFLKSGTVTSKSKIGLENLTIIIYNSIILQLW